MRPRSRAAVLATAVFALSAGAAAAQAPPGRVCEVGALRARLAAEPGRVSMADGRVSLRVPAGLRAMSPNEMPARSPFGELGSDVLAFGSGEGAAILVARTPPGDTPSEADLEIPEFQDLMSGMLELGAPGVELRSGWVTRGGARWFRIAPVRAGERGRGYAAMFFTAFQGGGVMAMFMVNDPRLAAEAERSAASLEVNDCAFPPGAAPDPRPASAAAPVCDGAEFAGRLASEPRRVAGDGGRVSLVAPEGMRAFTSAEIARMELSQPVEILLQHADALASVRFTEDISLVDMPRYREALERGLKAIHPDLQWHGHEMVEAGGARWLKVAYSRPVRGGERRFVNYFAAFRGRTLVVELSARAAEAPRWESALAGAMGTLELRDCEHPGETAG